MKLSKLALLALALSPGLAHAEGLKVEAAKRSFVMKTIDATKVKGVRVRITKNVEHDCNMLMIAGTAKLIEGDGQGYNDTYAGNFGVMSTLMACGPNRKLVKETIKSEPVDFKSFTNEYAHGEVHLELIIPQGMDLEVEEIN